MANQGHHSRHEGTILKDRFTSEDIFERILEVANEEVHTRNRELFFSALAAGFAITLTFFLYATLTYKTGGHPILSALLYPLGFLYIVLGNYQLYTENTLPPVALVLERLSSVPSMLRIWGVVLAGNVVGAILGAIILATTGVFSAGAMDAAIGIATTVSEVAWMDLFVRGAFAGFIVAGIVWLDYAAKSMVARFMLVYIAFLAIPLASLNHSVVTAIEAVFLSITTGASLFGGLWSMLLPVLLGNTIGGVLLVTIVNYFQTPSYITKGTQRLPIKTWLFKQATVSSLDEKFKKY